MSEELKPCPFCGTLPQANTWIFYGISETRYFCPNQECPLSVRASALERWNRRPIEDALTARVAELEAERRWIPVSERLPEIEEGDSKEYDVVITYPRESSVIVASWTYSAFDKTHQRRIWIEEQGEFGDKDITKYVTHWRERPTPPEVQE